MIKIGCCGWAYFSPKKYFGEKWKEKFSSTISAYSKKFDLVEVNSTFYRLPKVETAEKWHEQAKEVNPRFEFTVKASKTITHLSGFGNESLGEYEKVKEICSALKSKILLFQTPASFKPTAKNLKNVKKFFSKTDRSKLKIVWETRGEGWEAVVPKLFDELDLIHCVDIFKSKPRRETGLNYYRLHGLGKRMYDYKFTDKDLEKLKSLLGKNCYVLFNNFGMYEDGIRFKQLFD